MRTGLWFSGAGGSGVLVARKEDGSWSPPSGIMLHTAGLGFLVGVDIYDCVLVINNRKALEAFTKLRATLGGEISAVAGPVGMGGVLENDGKWKEANRPVFTYLKSRGFYAGVQVDGTIVIERNDENARFYNEKVGVGDILAGKVRHVPYGTKMLMETLKAAEGRLDVDTGILEKLEGQPPPGDIDIGPPHSNGLFGMPDPDDPDPYGVAALEKEGLVVVDLGKKPTPPKLKDDSPAALPDDHKGDTKDGIDKEDSQGEVTPQESNKVIQQPSNRDSAVRFSLEYGVKEGKNGQPAASEGTDKQVSSHVI